jgi:DNA-binding MltR family transcriptional regulator
MASDSLKTLTRSMPADGSEDVLHDLEHTESDRGAASLACSTVEYALRYFISKHMIELAPADHGRLFYNSGPLSDFGAMISVSYAFGLIDQKMREDLVLLKDIRNAFSHAPQRVTFEADVIKSRCMRFHSLAALKEKPASARSSYISAAKLLFIALKFAGAGQKLPLPFGLFYLPTLVPAPDQRKREPSPQISPEQLLEALESVHLDNKTPQPPPPSSQE